MDYRVSNPVCSPCFTSLSVSHGYRKLLLPSRVFIDIRQISPLTKNADYLNYGLKFCCSKKFRETAFVFLYFNITDRLQTLYASKDE